MKIRKNFPVIFWMVSVWIFLQFSFPAAASGNSVPVTIRGTCDYQTAYEVLELTNQLRAERGKSALVMDGDLMEAAMLRAAECRLIFDHRRPDGSPDDLEYDYWKVLPSKVNGENITISHGWTTAQEPVDEWHKSVAHYENLLTDSYRSTGIGCFRSDDVVCWVQLFGLQEADAPAQTLGNNVPRAFRVNMHYKYLDDYANIVLDKTYDPAGAPHTVKNGETKTLQLQFFYPIDEYGDPDEDIYTYPPYNSYTDPAGTYASLIPRLEWSDFLLESSDPSVLSVDGNGRITAKKAGTATITARHQQVSDEILSLQITVSDTASRSVCFYANGGSMNKDGKQDRAVYTYLYNKTYGTLPSAYRKGYSFAGWYTAKSGGSRITKNTVVRISKGTTQNIYAHWSKIKLAAPSIQKLSSPAKAKLKVKWKKLSGVTGYQVEISTTGKFGKKTENTITLKGASQTSFTFSKLKKRGAQYFVRMRAYRVDSAGKKVFSKYSKVLSMKVKK